MQSSAARHQLASRTYNSVQESAPALSALIRIEYMELHTDTTGDRSGAEPIFYITRNIFISKIQIIF